VLENDHNNLSGKSNDPDSNSRELKKSLNNSANKSIEEKNCNTTN